MSPAVDRRWQDDLRFRPTCSWLDVGPAQPASPTSGRPERRDQVVARLAALLYAAMGEIGVTADPPTPGIPVARGRTAHSPLPRRRRSLSLFGAVSAGSRVPGARMELPFSRPRILYVIAFGLGRALWRSVSSFRVGVVTMIIYDVLSSNLDLAKHPDMPLIMHSAAVTACSRPQGTSRGGWMCRRLQLSRELPAHGGCDRGSRAVLVGWAGDFDRWADLAGGPVTPGPAT